MDKVLIEILKQRNIPMKAIRNSYGVAFCPVCRGSLWQRLDETNFCFRCGQKIKLDK